MRRATQTIWNWQMRKQSQVIFPLLRTEASRPTAVMRRLCVTTAFQLQWALAEDNSITTVENNMDWYGSFWHHCDKPDFWFMIGCDKYSTVHSIGFDVVNSRLYVRSVELEAFATQPHLYTGVISHYSTCVIFRILYIPQTTL